jgi:hypothetical protein
LLHQDRKTNSNYKRDLVMSFSAAYYDAVVRKDKPSSLKGVTSNFPRETKQPETDKKKEAKP